MDIIPKACLFNRVEGWGANLIVHPSPLRGSEPLWAEPELAATRALPHQGGG